MFVEAFSCKTGFVYAIKIYEEKFIDMTLFYLYRCQESFGKYRCRVLELNSCFLKSDKNLKGCKCKKFTSTCFLWRSLDTAAY